VEKKFPKTMTAFDRHERDWGSKAGTKRGLGGGAGVVKKRGNEVLLSSNLGGESRRNGYLIKNAIRKKGFQETNLNASSENLWGTGGESSQSQQKTS